MPSQCLEFCYWPVEVAPYTYDIYFRVQWFIRYPTYPNTPDEILYTHEYVKSGIDYEVMQNVIEQERFMWTHPCIIDAGMEPFVQQ